MEGKTLIQAVGLNGSRSNFCTLYDSLAGTGGNYSAGIIKVARATES